MQESAVHKHSGRPAIIANADGNRQVWITRYGRPSRVRQMRRHNRVEIVGGNCVIYSRAGCGPGVGARGDVSRIVGIPRKLLRQFEDLLTVVNELLRAM